MWEVWTSLGDLGRTWTDEQQRIIALILSIGRSRGEPLHVLRSALAAGYVESRFRNLAYGDRDSLGVMQQRPSQGWGTREQILNPTYAINKYYEEAHKRRSITDPGRLAQAVQRSGYPSRYSEALPITDPLLGGSEPEQAPASRPSSSAPGGSGGPIIISPVETVPTLPAQAGIALPLILAGIAVTAAIAMR